MELRPAQNEGGTGIAWHLLTSEGTEPALACATPVTVEAVGPDGRTVNGERVERPYREFADGVGTAEVEVPGCGRYAVRDTWTPGPSDSWRVERRLEVLDAPAGAGVRLLLEVAPVLTGAARFDDLRLFAPAALYDLNDLDGDGVEDFLDTRTLIFRDDRLDALTVLGYSDARGVGFALSRCAAPGFDSRPEREPGEVAFLQRTDVGSLGVRPDDEGGARLVAAYPFVERDRSHALLARERSPWGAFWPAEPGAVLTVAYDVRPVTGDSPVDALWRLWSQRLGELAPRPVELTTGLDELTRLRVDALEAYYRENPGPEPVAAGFVTNCHPQDGKQLSNVIQYGFTGQNVLNALHLLRAGDREGASDRRAKAVKVIDFFVHTMAAPGTGTGLSHTLYDLDRSRPGNWWTGLLLPLAYAEGEQLERLMGPVYEHMREVVEALRPLEGAYLRCMAEEYDALLRADAYERDRGNDRPEWRAAATAFGEFLLSAQEEDGAWRRAYTFDGVPITTPERWFGETPEQQKSPTAAVVPLLLRLHRLTGDARYLDAAVRAGRFVKQHHVDGLKFNGGIHDSIYARAQLVDSEGILFPLRALLELHKVTEEREFLDGAETAARLLATWIFLWDVPLPPDSTLARYGFRTTGWSGCDTCGAGYIHPYEVDAAPDLLEVALLVGDPVLAEIAELVLVGSNETVSVEAGDWGYALPGLQEEGLLVSWWLIDDPMFAGTGFGGRGKGEGNKTCLPWISAVAIQAHTEMIARFGTTDVAAVRKRAGL
ncbi:hypothetical protein [Pseudonocardia sp. MH-G8]|uniref:hypothetical protein n=1 Tax=Pseudonocardia sp. MH-G8 TaxID=1854588 RepID=UPI00117BC26D|nr:hypothetical protein [Pseudonocardia sp. MH-G8]